MMMMMTMMDLHSTRTCINRCLHTALVDIGPLRGRGQACVRTSLELLLLSLQLHKLPRSLLPQGFQFCLALGTHLGYMRTLLSTSGVVLLD